jgi:hypothetical protein
MHDGRLLFPSVGERVKGTCTNSFLLKTKKALATETSYVFLIQTIDNVPRDVLRKSMLYFETLTVGGGIIISHTGDTVSS